MKSTPGPPLILKMMLTIGVHVEVDDVHGLKTSITKGGPRRGVVLSFAVFCDSPLIFKAWVAIISSHVDGETQIPSQKSGLFHRKARWSKAAFYCGFEGDRLNQVENSCSNNELDYQHTNWHTRSNELQTMMVFSNLFFKIFTFHDVPPFQRIVRYLVTNLFKLIV